MSDQGPHDYIPPPGPPLFGRGGPAAGGTSPKRESEADLAKAVERHHQEEALEASRRPWWKRLFGHT